MPEAAATHNQPEYTVSEIAGAVKRIVEDTFGYVRVRGEISGFKQAASGHLYFDLKDEKAVLNSVCWKGVAARFTFKPENGLEVVCSGRLSTYPGRSTYQLVVERMEPAGAGALMALLEQRKKQLAAEGLFDPARKKPRPYLPRVIGIVTSPTGAVIRDILHRLSERFPVRVLLWPVLVQGEGAAEQITRAINGFNQFPKNGLPRPDLLIVARGGGSIEDLWAFNEENVVRATAASVIPLISAVGHETDTTLIDYASDLRAPTPTAAAELAVPVREELLVWIKETAARLYRAIQKDIKNLKERVQGLARGLPRPAQILELKTQRLDDIAGRFSAGFPLFLERRKQRLALAAAGLTPKALTQSLRLHAQPLQQLEKRGALSVHQLLERKQAALTGLARILDSLDYQNVLKRGYALVKTPKGQVIPAKRALPPEGSVVLQFHDGEASATIGDKSKKTSGQGDLF